jgi:hypothetical protein
MPDGFPKRGLRACVAGGVPVKLKCFLRKLLLAITYNKIKIKIKIKMQQSNDAQREFIALPASIIQYIVGFLDSPCYDVHSPRDVILNCYKAFECYKAEGEGEDEDEDPLWDYKKNVQSYLATLVYEEVMVAVTVTTWKVLTPVVRYALTDREVMYLYDVLFCNSNVIIYGNEKTKKTAYELNVEEDIRNELDECSDYAWLLRDQAGPFTLPLVIRSLPVIRLLEEALYTESSELLNCIMQSTLNCKYELAMLTYIYINHTHVNYGRKKNRCLANNKILLGLMESILA